MAIEGAPRKNIEKSPADIGIDFSPEGMFGTELQNLPSIISEAVNMLKARDEQYAKLPIQRQYITAADKMRAQYKKLAAASNLPEETNDLIDSVFETMLGWKRVAEHYAQLPEIDRITHEAAAQQSAIRYIHRVNEAHRSKAGETLSRYWASQEQAWTFMRGKDNTEFSFDHYRKGILRQVAVEHVIKKVRGWKIDDPEDATNDVHRKIDILFDTGRYAVALQLKPIDFVYEKTQHSGIEVLPVDPAGPPEPETHLYKFQQGIRNFAEAEGLPLNIMRGAYVGVSAKQEYINRVTGLPAPKFAQVVADELTKVFDTPPAGYANAG